MGARSRTRGFAVQERRWVIERTFGTFGHNRRLARDHKGRPDVAAGWITLASAAQMLRRLARARVSKTALRLAPTMPIRWQPPATQAQYQPEKFFTGEPKIAVCQSS